MSNTETTKAIKVLTLTEELAANTEKMDRIKDLRKALNDNAKRIKAEIDAIINDEPSPAESIDQFSERELA
jgi:hypothetical protein